jgi:NAD(P)-dependent dehydrogenase (short-subunit alcohol dehydrogenase family)
LTTDNRIGAFNFAQSTLPLLQKSTGLQHPPTLIFTGATASVKGSANFAAFATGKFALRALAQSLAREFGPKGVHVSHVIIDGVIDIPRTKDWANEHEDGKLDPGAVCLSPAPLPTPSGYLVLICGCRLRMRTGTCIRSRERRLDLSWIFVRMLRSGKR